MQLLVVRHAIAEDRDDFAATGQDDRQRPLTPGGARKMTRAVGGLRAVVASIDVIAASPLVRAAETAEIIRAAYDVERVVSEPSLVPEGTVADVTRWLSTQRADVVAVVGHEPQLGHLVSYLVGGGDRPAVEMKKGAACLLEFTDSVVEGGARLIWLLPPRVLRRLAG